MEHVIELTAGVIPDCIVERKNKDTIKWKNDTDTDYTIHFTNYCPIVKNDFTVPAHKTKGPHALKDPVEVGTHVYEANAKRDTGKAAVTNVAADPNVIVR